MCVRDDEPERKKENGNEMKNKKRPTRRSFFVWTDEDMQLALSFIDQ
jgi:hypothetical protein